MNLSNAYDIILVVAGIVLTGLSAWDLIKNWVKFGWPKRIRDGVGVLRADRRSRDIPLFSSNLIASG